MPRRPTSAARALLLAAAVLMATLAARLPAWSQTGDLPDELRTIADVRFRGLHHVSRGQIREAAGLRTRRPSRLPWRERPLLRRDYLRSDSSAIVSLYRHYGYLDASVHVRLVEGGDPRSAVVEFVVTEGALTRVGRVDLGGVQVFTTAELERVLLAQPGRAYDPAFLQIDALKLRTLYQEHGYSARVDTSALRGVPDSAHVGVRYDVREGPQYRIGRIEYLHGPRVRESLGRRELMFKPDDVFKRSRLDRSIEHLYGTGLFRQVQVTTVPDSTTSRIDLLVRVSERAPRWVDVGIGSGTANRYQITGEFGHRNIDTRARGAVLAGQLARDGQNHPRTEAASLTLSDPWFLGVRLLFQTSGLYRHEHDRTNPGYAQNLEKRGFNFSLYRELSRIARATLVQENTFAHQSYELFGGTTSDSLDPVVPSYRTNTLRLTLERDLRDNKIAPRHGSYQVVSTELAGGPLKGTSSYNKALVSSTWYTPMRNGWLFAARASGGVIQPFGGLSANFSPEVGLDREVGRVPLDSRFKIGGVNSMRGYPENGIPPNGGLAMALVNIEWRIPVVGPFGLEVFVDAGNVWARPEYIRLDNLVSPWNARGVETGEIRYTYGVGGRLVLPFGPLRIDVATSDRNDFPRGVKFFGGARLPFVYQFAIGPSF